MAFQPTAAQARERAQSNRVITEEVMLLELTLATAIAASLLTIELGEVDSGGDPVTTDVHGSTITGSPMTQDNATGQLYYNVWKETVTDTTKTEQMSEVINYFQDRGYTISRKSSDSSVFYWDLTW